MAGRFMAIRTCGTSACCSVATSTVPGTSLMTASTARRPCAACAGRAEDVQRDAGARARQHVVDAVADGLADGDLRAGNGRQRRAQLLEHIVVAWWPSEVEPHVDLGGVGPLRVLVQLGAARPARRLLHRRVGEQDLLHPAAQRVRLGEGRAGQRDGADDERALLELGQERTAERGDHGQGGEHQGGSARHHGTGLRSTGSSVRA
jgi:hypothetical protein